MIYALITVNSYAIRSLFIFLLITY